MVSSESPVPHNTNKAAKYTNCAMLQELKRSTLLFDVNSIAFVTFSVMVCDILFHGMQFKRQ